MNTSPYLSFVLALVAPAAIALAADENAGTKPDTANWKCELCPFEQGRSGTFDLGLGYVSDDSFKFGEYTGLNDKGGYLIGGADLRSRDKNGGYWNLNASNLGLDSRSLQADVGKQGKYGLLFQYDELPHFISDTASTPFGGTGGNRLGLGSGWVRAGSTAGMTELGARLHPVDIDTDRKRVGLGATFVTDSNWQYAVKVRHETKEGTLRAGGPFFFNTAQLIMPVDYVTDQIDVSMTHATAKWQTRLAYYGSTFRNHNDALTWQNPFTGLVAGADTGQLALPPDNQFHQIAAALGYQFTEHTRASADIAVGHMTQNQDFLAPTLNTTLAVPALPRNSLDGRVDTLNADLRLMSDLTDRLRLSATYAYNDRNNKTPQATYTWVTTDTFVATPRTNLPYSFTDSSFKLGADYRMAPRVKTSAGVDFDSHERTFQEADKTRETTVWGKVVTRAQDNVDFTFKAAHADRNVSSYQAVPQIDPPENPLLRKYNMADRRRDSVGVHTNVTPSENVNIGLGIDFSSDTYPNSTIGLTRGDDMNVSADTSVTLSQDSSVNLFLNHEQITSMQAGSELFATPDWSAHNEDTVDTVGVGVKHTVIRNKLDLGADYSVSRTRGEITVISGTPMPFPDLTTRLGTVKLYATYALQKNISLHGAYWYEHYRTRDWMLDGVAPDTVTNLLSLGQLAPSYHVNVLSLFMRYKF